MELIYLYIEDYKNIKNQEFNFSSKFTCKYDDINKRPLSKLIKDISEDLGFRWCFVLKNFMYL